nr:protein FAF-like, chloroplastic [Ipomoea batatas]
MTMSNPCSSPQIILLPLMYPLILHCLRRNLNHRLSLKFRSPPKSHSQMCRLPFNPHNSLSNQLVCPGHYGSGARIRNISMTNVWSSILQSHKIVNPSFQFPPPYAHPLDKKSATSLTGKCLEICTESLSFETGSDCFSSYPSSESGDEEKDDHESPLFSEEFRAVKHNYSKKSLSRSFPPSLPSLLTLNYTYDGFYLVVTGGSGIFEGVIGQHLVKRRGGAEVLPVHAGRCTTRSGATSASSTSPPWGTRQKKEKKEILCQTAFNVFFRFPMPYKAICYCRCRGISELYDAHVLVSVPNETIFYYKSELKLVVQNSSPIRKSQSKDLSFLQETPIHMEREFGAFITGDGWLKLRPVSVLSSEVQGGRNGSRVPDE